MNNKGNSERVRSSYDHLMQYIPIKLPGMGWYFSDYCPGNAIISDEGGWPCMFEEITKVSLGRTLCLSKQYPGCAGAACYLGYEKPLEHAGRFLAEKENYKKNPDLGDAFFDSIEAPPPRTDYLVLDTISDMADDIDIEVVVLWVDAQSLAALVTLANYDKPSNDNVLLPFASGCQSIWTIPFREKFKSSPKAVAGMMEPSTRRFLPAEVLSFAVWSNRFIEMSGHITGSFLENESWIRLVHPYFN